MVRRISFHFISAIFIRNCIEIPGKASQEMILLSVPAIKDYTVWDK